jgi:molecular chaperone GrpE
MSSENEKTETPNTNSAKSENNGPEKSAADLAQEEITKWKNEYLYLRAEFDNFRKQTIKERSDLLKFGAERMAREILEVMDNFERALQTPTTPETLKTFRVGVEMTAKELKEALNKSGIQEIPCEGLAFNPLQHEAISSEPSTTVPAGHVTRVFKKPYKLHDKVIRMGQVVVATAPITAKDDN